MRVLDADLMAYVWSGEEASERAGRARRGEIEEVEVEERLITHIK